MNLTEQKKANSLRSIRSLLASACALMLVFTFILVAPGATFATSTTAGNAFSSMMDKMTNEIYQTMRQIAIPIIICFFGYAGITFLTGGSRGAEKAMTICKYCLAAVVLVAFAPLFGQTIGNWVASDGTGNITDYNPMKSGGAATPPAG